MEEFFLTMVVGLLVFLIGIVFVIMMIPLFIIAGAIFTVSFIAQNFFIDDYG